MAAAIDGGTSCEEAAALWSPEDAPSLAVFCAVLLAVLRRDRCSGGMVGGAPPPAAVCAGVEDAGELEAASAIKAASSEVRTFDACPLNASTCCNSAFISMPLPPLPPPPLVGVGADERWLGAPEPFATVV